MKASVKRNTTLLPPLVTINQEIQEAVTLVDLAVRTLPQGPKPVKKLMARTAKQQTISLNSKSFLAKTHKNSEVVEATEEEMKSRDQTLIKIVNRDPPDNEVEKVKETTTQEKVIKPQGSNLEATAEVKTTVDLASQDWMLTATKFLS